MRTYFKATILFFTMTFSPTSYAENSITCQCSWDKAKPINVIVNPAKGTATRDDGGSIYNIIKITKYAVWLEVSKPYNQFGMAIQMIQRSEGTNKKAGKWVDVVMNMDGTVLPVDGGVCWEQ